MWSRTRTRTRLLRFSSFKPSCFSTASVKERGSESIPAPAASTPRQRRKRRKTRCDVIVEREVERAVDTGAVLHWIGYFAEQNPQLLRELVYGDVLAEKPEAGAGPPGVFRRVHPVRFVGSALVGICSLHHIICMTYYQSEVGS